MATPDNLRVISNPLRMRPISRAGFKMAAVGRWLESHHVYVQNDWLEACINFVKEDNEVLKLCVDIVRNSTAKNVSTNATNMQERQLSHVELNELVYEQWLMADIQESSLPRLPEELGNRDICKLEGHFNLQVMTY